jgi:TetR/AcrR family transcriptional regulator, regulator of autoinduction and epiphytic fitness
VSNGTEQEGIVTHRRPARRSYESPKRRERAAATRRQIVASARRLFTARGYAATTIDAIAEQAGVAPPTVYATFGSKRAVLLALLDQMEADADLPALRRDLRAAAADPHRQLGTLVDFEVRLYERAADVLAIVRGAGQADADLTELWQRGEGRRRAGLAPIVRGWRRHGALRDGLTARQAVDVLWSLTGADAYRLFVEECGWSGRQYRDWLTHTLAALVLA